MSQGQLNILLVDDDEQEFTHIDKLLSEINNWQCHLEQVSTYESALQKIRQTAPDICLLNPHLPESNGTRHLHQLFAPDFAPPLILLTRPNAPGLPEGIEAAEAVDQLTSGEIDATRLHHSLQHAIRYKHLKNALEREFETRIAHLTTENVQLRKELIQSKHEAAVRQEREGLYQGLFNIDIYGVEVLDAQGRVTDCNVTFQNILGYSRDEILGQPTTAFVTARDRPRLREKLQAVRAEGYAEGEIELVCKDGTEILVWRRWRAITGENGQYVGAVAYSRDITDRMKAVRQISTLARALEQSPTALLVTDHEGLIEYANFRFTELSGYTYEELVGQPLSLVKSPEQTPDLYEEMWETINAGEEWRGEFRNLRKDGEVYWEDLAITPMFNPQGGISHFVAVQEDITERKAFEEEEYHSQQRLGDLMSEHISDLTTAKERLEQEVEERKRAETELRRSRARLKAQYKGIPVPTYTWQKSGNDLVLVDYNDVAERESQGRIVDFMGQPVSQVFRNDPQVLADFEHCFKEKSTVTREAPYQLVTTGEMKYFVTTYNYVPPHLVVVHIQDVTERKQLEDELNHYKQQLENAPDQDVAGELARVQAALEAEIDKRRQLEAELEQQRRQVPPAPDALQAELDQLKQAFQQEVSRREQVEQALQEREEQFQQIAGNIDERLREQYRTIPIPTYTWQRIADEFILIDFNDAAANSMGKIVDFFGKAVHEIFKNRPEVLADFETCYREKRKVVREAPYKMITTGETRFFVTTYNFVPPNLVVDHIQDITEQKKLEVELEEYQRKYEALQQNQAEANAATQRLQQEIAQREATEQALRALQEEIQTHHDQLEDVVKERTAELTRLNQKLQREIFDHERAEESLREARVRLKAQYKGIPVPTYSWRRVGDDFVLVDYNYAAEKASQGRIAKFISKKARDVFKERPQVVSDFVRCYSEKGKVVREAPYRLITTGEIRYFITTYNFAPPNLIIVYIQDVTALKQLEDKVQDSLEQIELQCRISPEGKVTFVNDAFCWYFDENREKLLGCEMPFVLAEERQKVQAHFNALHQHEPVGSIEFRMEKADGSIRWLRWISRAIFDKHGRLVEYRLTGKDVTRRKEPET